MSYLDLERNDKWQTKADAVEGYRHEMVAMGAVSVEVVSVTKGAWVRSQFDDGQIDVDFIRVVRLKANGSGAHSKHGHVAVDQYGYEVVDPPAGAVNPWTGDV